MPITSIQPGMNFGRRIRHAEGRRPTFHFATGYNALVGPNDCGKTTLLDALDHDENAFRKTDGNHRGFHYLTSERINPKARRGARTRTEMIVEIRKSLDRLDFKGFQVIAATHHPVFYQNAHIIELAPGYFSSLNREWRHLVEVEGE